MKSCFFHDSSVAIPYNRIDHRHRKIVQYIAHADFSDDTNGHGTHVVCTDRYKPHTCTHDLKAGSIAGNAGDNVHNSQYNGLAPNAKLAFFDLGVSGVCVTISVLDMRRG